MTQRIAQVIYTPTSKVNDQCIAVFACDSSVDSDWVFPTEGSDNTGGSDTIIAKYAILDNMTNIDSARIIFGLQTYLVSPYTRRTFALPENTLNVEVQVTSGIVYLTLCQNNMNVPDEVDQLMSNSVGNAVGEYNPFFFCVGQTPAAGQVLFLHKFEEPVSYQPNFNGFQGGVSSTYGTNPAASYPCDVQRNGTSVGTLTYNTDGTCTATTVGATTGTFAVGDEMEIIGATPADGSILNFSGTFTMTPS